MPPCLTVLLVVDNVILADGFFPEAIGVFVAEAAADVRRPSSLIVRLFFLVVLLVLGVLLVAAVLTVILFESTLTSFDAMLRSFGFILGGGTCPRDGGGKFVYEGCIGSDVAFPLLLAAVLILLSDAV